MAAPLHYALPTTASPPTYLLSVSLVCWAIPLFFGVCAAAGWRLTGNDAFAIGGVFTIVIGCILCAVGILLLIAYRWQIHRLRLGNWRNVSRNEILILVLLLSNFPVAFGIVQYVEYVMDQYRILIVNKSSGAMTNVRLNFARRQIVLTDVPADSERKFAVSLGRGEGDIELVFTTNGQEHRSLVEGYHSAGFNNPRDRTTVTVQDDGVTVSGPSP